MRKKLRVLDWLRHHRVAVTLNFVIHRRNIDQLEENAGSRGILVRDGGSNSPTSSITAGLRQKERRE